MTDESGAPPAREQTLCNCHLGHLPNFAHCMPAACPKTKKLNPTAHAAGHQQQPTPPHAQHPTMTRRPSKGAGADPGTEFFPDWRGDIALQNDLTSGPRLETLAGLDRSAWLVVAATIDLACSSHDTDHVYLDAVDLTALGIDPSCGSFTEIAALANQYGELPATRIKLTAADSHTIVEHMTRGRIRLRATGIDADLTIIATVSRR